MISDFVLYKNPWVVHSCNSKNQAFEIGSFVKELIFVNCLGSLDRLSDLGYRSNLAHKKLDFVLNFIGTEKTARWEAAVRESLWGAGASASRNGTSSQPVSSRNWTPVSDITWRMEYQTKTNNFKTHSVIKIDKHENFRRPLLCMGN